VSDPLFDVAGRVVVVTGGLGQLGSEYVRALAERGARVAVFDLDEGEQGEQVRSWRADVTDRASLERALAEVGRSGRRRTRS
jgi:NAD(P)-dependent dehydrogenase (short-subunit alcohol dehydrogenase family)